MIYLPSQTRWYSSSSCLWTDETGIPGKVGLKRDYPGLSHFFVRKLDIQKPDLGLYVNELIALCENPQEPPHDQVRQLIQRINAFKPCQEDVVSLQSVAFLPVRNAQEAVELTDPSSTFAIIDRQEHTTLFQNFDSVLDYDIEGIRALRYLLNALGLHEHYTSVMAVESSSARNSSKSDKLSEDFAQRAYALFR